MSEKKKAMSQYFSENLNAPFTNIMWSWGSENEIGIYLRIWKDEFKGSNYILHKLSNAVSNDRLGQKERLNHVKSIYQGKPGYVVVITKHHRLPNNQKVIDDYDECIYKIMNININDDGEYIGEIDLANPIHPSYIDKIVCNDDAINLCKNNSTSLTKLDKAINKLGWRVINIDQENIYLISKDSKATAKLHIPTADWIRI